MPDLALLGIILAVDSDLRPRWRLLAMYSSNCACLPIGFCLDAECSVVESSTDAVQIVLGRPFEVASQGRFRWVGVANL